MQKLLSHSTQNPWGVYLQLWPASSSLISLALFEQCGSRACPTVLLCQPHVHKHSHSCHQELSPPAPRHCPRAWWDYFTPSRAARADTEQLVCPQYKQDQKPHSAGRSKRMKNPSGLHWHLDIGAQKIKTQMKYNHGIGRLAKAALRPCHVQPFNQSKAICAGTQLKLQSCSSCTEITQDGTLCTEENCANNERSSSLQLEGTQSQQPQPELLSSAPLASAAGLAAQLCSLPQWHQGFPLSRATKLPPSLCRVFQAHPDPSFPFLSGWGQDLKRVDQPAHLWLVSGLFLLWFHIKARLGNTWDAHLSSHCCLNIISIYWPMKLREKSKVQPHTSKGIRKSTGRGTLDKYSIPREPWLSQWETLHFFQHQSPSATL